MGYREFVDEIGAIWRVWDVKPQARTTPGREVQAVSNSDGPRHVAAGWGQGWLAFQSDVETRRLRPIPGRWEITGEHSLRKHLRNALEVKPRSSGNSLGDTLPPMPRESPA